MMRLLLSVVLILISIIMNNAFHYHSSSSLLTSSSRNKNVIRLNDAKGDPNEKLLWDPKNQRFYEAEVIINL